MDASQNVNIQVFNLDSLRKLLATYCNNKANILVSPTAIRVTFHLTVFEPQVSSKQIVLEMPISL